MGLPFGTTFVNIFMCFKETVWLSDCPLSFQPIFYWRHVDDVFFLFMDRSDLLLFLDFIENKHLDIKITIAHEYSNTFIFLDCVVSWQDNKFVTYAYKKSSF